MARLKTQRAEGKVTGHPQGPFLRSRRFVVLAWGDRNLNLLLPRRVVAHSKALGELSSNMPCVSFNFNSKGPILVAKGGAVRKNLAFR